MNIRLGVDLNVHVIQSTFLLGAYICRGSGVQRLRGAWVDLYCVCIHVREENIEYVGNGKITAFIWF